MPQELGDAVFAARYLEVRQDLAFVIHENDSGHVGGDSQDHIDLAVGPGAHQALLSILHLHIGVKKHCHLVITVSLS